MPRLPYVGPEPARAIDLLTRSHGQAIIDTAPLTRTQVAITVEDQADDRAGKDYIDLADAGYATADYYQSVNALNIAATAIGAPDGVAALVDGTIPAAQLPVLGSGLLKGPFGPTTLTPVTGVTTTPATFAQFAIGNQSVAFQPWGYAVVAVDSKPGGRPIIDMRLNGVLIAQATGSPMYNGRQILTLVSGSETLGAANPGPWPLNTAITVTMTLASSSSVPMAVGSASVLSAAVYLLKMAA